MVKIEYLRHFIAASETGSFTAAAAKSHISTTSIRNSIDKLETTLNTTLFLRKPSNGVALTGDGRKLLEQSKDLLINVEELENSFSTSDRTLKGTLTIGCQEGLTWSLIPRAIKKINAAHPNLSVSVKTIWMDTNLDSIDNAEVDVLITFSIQNTIAKKFHVVDLCSPQTCVMMRKDHPLDNGKPVNLKDLAKYPHIFIKDGPGWELFYTMYSERNLEPNVHMYSNISTGAQSVVGCTDAVSLRILRPANPYTPLGDPMVVPPLKDEVRRPRLVAVTNRIRRHTRLDKRLVFIEVCQDLFDSKEMRSHIYY